MQAASAYDREMFAVSEVVLKWRQYLLVIPDLLDQLRQYYAAHPDGQTLIQQIPRQPHDQLTYSPSNGFVMYKDCNFVPVVGDLSQRLLAEFHDSTIGGHSGVSATVARLATSFYWPRLLTDVKAYIKQCATYQSIKYNTQKLSGTLQLLSMPP
ncbi:UNVERIFIED_CONTAM: hypothetical protein Sradi_2377700 [Sesamum radiatum]|uniref:Integrase zinc-binding domain-containing protein n=1 Tax=Sesamum radiatum TaxID=300843 RepID=A0AAW2T6H2_SESRA